MLDCDVTGSLLVEGMWGYCQVSVGALGRRGGFKRVTERVLLSRARRMATLFEDGGASWRTPGAFCFGLGTSCQTSGCSTVPGASRALEAAKALFGSKEIALLGVA